MTLKNGCIYEGQWENDYSHGFGKITCKDKSSYKGEFKYGKK